MPLPDSKCLFGRRVWGPDKQGTEVCKCERRKYQGQHLLSQRLKAGTEPRQEEWTKGRKAGSGSLPCMPGEQSPLFQAARAAWEQGAGPGQVAACVAGEGSVTRAQVGGPGMLLLVQG